MWCVTASFLSVRSNLLTDACMQTNTVAYFTYFGEEIPRLLYLEIVLAMRNVAELDGEPGHWTARVGARPARALGAGAGRPQGSRSHQLYWEGWGGPGWAELSGGSPRWVVLISKKQQLPYLGGKNGSLVSELEENLPPFPNSALFVGLLYISAMVLVLNHQHSATTGVHRIPQPQKHWYRGA